MISLNPPTNWHYIINFEAREVCDLWICGAENASVSPFMYVLLCTVVVDRPIETVRLREERFSLCNINPVCPQPFPRKDDVFESESCCRGSTASKTAHCKHSFDLLSIYFVLLVFRKQPDGITSCLKVSKTRFFKMWPKSMHDKKLEKKILRQDLKTDSTVRMSPKNAKSAR